MLTNFTNPECWLRSAKKGTLWRKWQGKTLAVFRSPRGYSWSVADGSGPKYSKEAYDSETEALEALARHLETELKESENGSRKTPAETT